MVGGRGGGLSLNRLRRFVGSSAGALAAAALVIAALVFMAAHRTPVDRVWADEGTFLAMVESLVHDRDLRFDERDEARILPHAEAPPRDPRRARASLILERTPKGIAYSKPIVFPLMAAPFHALFGERGLVLLNALALGAALLLAWVALRLLARRDRLPPALATWTVVSFTCAATLLPYLFWRMADLLQAALVLAGLALCFARDFVDEGGEGDDPESDDPESDDAVHDDAEDDLPAWLAPVERTIRGWLLSPAAPWIGTALVAVTVPMRLSNLALAGIPALAALFRWKLPTAIGRGLVTLGTVGLLVALTYGFTGAPDPYKAERTTFLPDTGYPAGDDAVEVMGRFDLAPASHRAKIEGPLEVLYAALYFFVGRHTGIVFYFPAAILFLALAIFGGKGSSRARQWAALVGFAVVTIFFVAGKPENYFGGETFIGNRYFLSVYAVLLMALPRLPSARSLVVTWLVACVSLGSGVVSVARYHGLDQGSQSHAHAGIFRLLPYESTAQGMAGRRDRYWAGQMVRFVDPFADVHGDGFELEAGRPAAEVMVVFWQDPGALRFEVETGAEKARLTLSDWRGDRHFQVGKGRVPQGGAVGLEVAPARPWRYHRFWFEDQVYWARILRLRLDAEPGTRAVVRHLGDPAVIAGSFAYERLGDDLGRSVPAGSRSTVRVKLRNTGSNHWEPKDVVAVSARWRLWREGAEVGASGRIDLPERVPPGQPVELELPVDWPEEPGRVVLEVDLVVEHVAWFQDRLGEPVLRRAVRVEEAPDGD